MGETESSTANSEEFLAQLNELARLLRVDATSLPDERPERRLLDRLRKPLRSANMGEEFFVVLMAAAVNDPNPSSCRWFIEPALHVFGRTRVQGSLIEYLRFGGEGKQAGAIRAWYWSRMPLSPDHPLANSVRERSANDVPNLAYAWPEALMVLFAGSSSLRMQQRILSRLPVGRNAYPLQLRGLFDSTVTAARRHADGEIQHWAACATSTTTR